MDYSNFCNFHKFFRETSNLLVSNIYLMVEFKIRVFAQLNEESPKRSIFKVKIISIKNIFFNILKVGQEFHSFIKSLEQWRR